MELMNLTSIDMFQAHVGTRRYGGMRLGREKLDNNFARFSENQYSEDAKEKFEGSTSDGLSVRW